MRNVLTCLILSSISSLCCAESREFSAVLNSDAVISMGANQSNSTGTGTASFVLTTVAGDPMLTTISYQINLTGFDLDGSQTADLKDDVTAIHFHDTNVCVSAGCELGDTAGTKHVLNVFGVPRHDDSEMQAFPDQFRVTGNWDASDANTLTPAPSFAPADLIEQLNSGQLFVMVHSREYPSGAVGGYVVPEPSSLGMAWLFGVLIATRLRRKNAVTHR